MSLPYPPRALIPVGSHLLFPEALGGGPGERGWGAPQSHTSRHVRHCLGKVCFGIAGDKSCWCGFGSLCLPASLGWGVGLRASSAPTHSETLKDGWVGAGCVSVEVGLSRCRNGERREDGSGTPIPSTKTVQVGGLRERIQAKIKSSHCIICYKKKNPKLYIYMYMYSIALHCRSEYHWRSRSGVSVCRLSWGAGQLLLAPGS